jgi:hypothetical protein
MKIGINDGCANGGMMDSLSIGKMEEDPDWEPFVQVEVTEEEWTSWEVFLKEHEKWETFWNNKMFPPKKKK